MPPDKTAAERAATPSLARGASIGRYVVLGLVGKGGMGEVYAAYDPELDRKVAVKLLRAQPGNGLSQSEGRARILREAQAIAKLSHPNVVVVFDVGTFQDQVFIAMEFLDGNTLGYWLKAKDRSPEEVLRVFIAAGRGLQAAHEKDLVHRDFKPDNVMVAKDGQVRVMDFGLARQVHERPPDTQPRVPTLKRVTLFTEEGDEIPGAGDTLPAATIIPGGDAEDLKSTNVIPSPVGDASDGKPVELMHHVTSSAFEAHLTRTGSMMGTPAYMSPEQFLGKQTDARTDQFSFCIALYEGLYGERPFAGKTLFGLTSNVVQGQILEPPANTKVPAWIRKILLRGLKTDAKERFPSMKDLLATLEKNPAAARRKVMLGVAALLLPLVVGVGVRQSMKAQRSMCEGGPGKLVGIWELDVSRQTETARKQTVRNAMLNTGKPYATNVYRNVRRALDDYAKSWADMYRETCEATHSRGDQSGEVLDLRMSCLGERLESMKALTQVFANSSGETVENALSAVHALPSLDRCADVPLLRAVVRPPDDPVVRNQVTEIRHRLAEVKALDASGAWTTAISKGTELAKDARQLKYLPLVAETLNVFGLLQQRLGDPKSAERSLEEAYWAAEIAQHDDMKAEVATHLVWVVGCLQERPEEGERWARHAEATLDRLRGHERLRAWLLNNLGTVYEARGQADDALVAMEKSLALKEKVLPAGHPDLAISVGNIAGFLQVLGRYQEALQHSDRVLAILDKGVGADHPEFASQLSNRGEILRGLRRHAEARMAFTRAVAIWERELDHEHPNLAHALTGIGETYLDEGAAEKAVAPLERALRIREAKERASSLKAETRFALGRALWETQEDSERSWALVRDARADYAQAGLDKRLSAVDRWIMTHSTKALARRQNR